MQENFPSKGSKQPLEFQNQGAQDSDNEDTGDKIYLEQENTISSDTKKNSSYSYQTQKIIINEIEDNESPTYKDFFEKEHKVLRSTENKTEGNENRTPPRWKVLYEKVDSKLSAKESKLAREELRKEYESQNEDLECTFKPRLLTSYNKTLNTAESMENIPVLPVHERAKLWKSRVQTRLLESREIVKDRDLAGCTFKPDIKISQTKEYTITGLTRYGSKGVDLFLKRQIIAKQSKEEKDTILDNPLSKLPQHVYKKEGKVTIPKEPEFNKGKNFDINSLKKPFEFPVPKSAEKCYTLDDSSPNKNVNKQQVFYSLDVGLIGKGKSDSSRPN